MAIEALMRIFNEAVAEAEGDGIKALFLMRVKMWAESTNLSVAKPYLFPNGWGRLSGEVTTRFRDQVTAKSDRLSHFIDIRVVQTMAGLPPVDHAVLLTTFARGPFKSPKLDQSPIRIICFDGGGVRGYMQAIALRMMKLKFETLLSETWGFGGVSTGICL